MQDVSNDKHEFEADLVALIPSLRAFGRSLSGDATQGDDLAQEALANAWKARDSFEPGTNLKAWTFMILRNLFYSARRRSWRTVALDPEVAEQTITTIDAPDRRLELDELRRALNMLTKDQREAIILVGAAGLAYDAAAEILNVAVGTVKSRVSRARCHLEAILAGGEIDSDGRPPEAAFGAIFQCVDACQRQKAA